MSMLLMVPLLVVAIMVAAVVLKLATKGGREPRLDDRGPWPYQARRLLSAPEEVLFHRLQTALPGRVVLTQVQVSRVIGVKAGVDFNAWHNRINRLSYDFVICAPDFSVLAAIELDDKTHRQPARIDADQRKDRASAAAGIRLIRWPVTPLPDEATIRQAFAEPNATPPSLEPTPRPRARTRA